MDYSCRDIPMRLDINNQPLNFDIYLSQVTDIPRASTLDEEPYNFSLEIEALLIVDKIVRRTKTPTTTNSTKQQLNHQPADHTPLTPIKSSIHLPEHSSTSSSNAGASTNASNTNNNGMQPDTSKSQINPREFEDINYDPFDHLELQTIDELRELNLVFQATQNSANSIQQKPDPPEAGL